MRNLPVFAAAACRLLHRITPRTRIGLAAVLSLMSYSTARAADSPKKPNVLITHADDMG